MENRTQSESNLMKEIKRLKTKCTNTENKYRKAIEDVRLLKERLDTIQYALDGRYDPNDPMTESSIDPWE
tara:strand:+ start:2391 stop:2600 length:210 start_codon:yes stop_codon:yes gene_type:complete